MTFSMTANVKCTVEQWGSNLLRNPPYLSTGTDSIGVTRGGKMGHAPKISSIPCRFVLRDAVSQIKYCCFGYSHYMWLLTKFWACYAADWFTLLQVQA